MAGTAVAGGLSTFSSFAYGTVVLMSGSAATVVVASAYQAIEAIGSVLAGSDRPFVVTSGTGLANIVPGQPAREDNPIINSSVIPRAASEEAAASVAARGVNVWVVRLPQVHDQVRQGLITYAVALAREKGVSPYVGDGLNRWPAAHVLDTAHLYRLALEKQEPSTTRSLKKECRSAISRKSLAGD